MARAEVRPRVLRLRAGGGGGPRLSTEDRIEIALAIPVRDGRVLVARRPDDAHQGGVFEFPGGKVEPGETAAAAARRELHEETGLSQGEIEPLVVFVHDYPDRRIRVHAFLVREPAGEPSTGGRPWAWMTVAGLADLPMPPANRSILRALAWRFGILSDRERADDGLPRGRGGPG